MNTCRLLCKILKANMGFFILLNQEQNRFGQFVMHSKAIFHYVSRFFLMKNEKSFNIIKSHAMIFLTFGFNLHLPISSVHLDYLTLD